MSRPAKFEWQDALLDTGALTSMQKFVGLALATYANGKGANAHPSVATLARRTTLSQRTVQAALRGLRDRGWIKDVTPAEKKQAQHYGWANVYALTIPTPGASHDRGGAGGAPGVPHTVRPKNHHKNHEEDSAGAAAASASPTARESFDPDRDEIVPWILAQVGELTEPEIEVGNRMLRQHKHPHAVVNTIWWMREQAS